MKSLKFVRLCTASMLIAVALTGCKKTPKSVTPIPGARTGGAPGAGTPSSIERNPRPVDPGFNVPPPIDTNANRIPQNSDGTSALGAREEEGNYFLDREVFKQQTAYFDYDRSEVKPAERTKLESVAAYLKSNPTNHLRIEGNCDERGTEEYNRSLGERRALSAREYLIGLGIAAERIGTISYGEDKPADPGHDEAAWARNRRAEFVLMKPKA